MQLLYIMNFDLGYGGNEYCISVYPALRVIVLKHTRRPDLNGMYVPKPTMVWQGALCQRFENLVDHICIDRMETLWGGKVVKQAKYLSLRYNNTPNQCIDVNFYPWSDPSNQTYVSFVKISNFYMDGFRLAQSRIRNNPRRLAVVMSLHPRLGAESLFGVFIGEELLRVILLHAFAGI